MKYSNTIIGAVLALVGMAIVAFAVLPAGPATTIFSGLIVVVVLQLLAIRQSEANGHRLGEVEKVADVAIKATETNSLRLDMTGAPPVDRRLAVDPLDESQRRATDSATP